MARPKKVKAVKAVKVKKQRKERTKKIKNSFLEINKTYEFYLYTPYDNDDFIGTFIGKLLNANPDEFYLESVHSDTKTIIKRSNIYMITEHDIDKRACRTLEDQNY